MAPSLRSCSRRAIDCSAGAGADRTRRCACGGCAAAAEPEVDEVLCEEPVVTSASTSRGSLDRSIQPLEGRDQADRTPTMITHLPTSYADAQPMREYLQAADAGQAKLHVEAGAANTKARRGQQISQFDARTVDSCRDTQPHASEAGLHPDSKLYTHRLASTSSRVRIAIGLRRSPSPVRVEVRSAASCAPVLG